MSLTQINMFNVEFNIYIPYLIIKQKIDIERYLLSDIKIYVIWQKSAVDLSSICTVINFYSHLIAMEMLWGT